MKIHNILSACYIISFQSENDLIGFYKLFRRNGLFKTMRLKPLYGGKSLKYLAKLPQKEFVLLQAKEFCELKKLKKHQFAALCEHTDLPS
ncbi:MAG: hypothetical protein KBS41_05420 [Oscillospiraceae bacterium]|nr:hypothetical protein [Candidatus Equicaccousia limihippi]